MFAQERLLEILRDELNHEYKELKEQHYAPYYMNFRVIDKHTSSVSASFGAEKSRVCFRQRRFIPQIRLGSMELDNFKDQPMGAATLGGEAPLVLLPLSDEDGEMAIRQAIWNETSNRYQFAMDVFQNSLARQKVSVEDSDKAPCFSEVPVVNYFEKPLQEDMQTLKLQEWSEKMKRISSVFNDYPELMSGEASITYIVERRYFLNTEGSEIVQNLTYARIMVNGKVKADDGMLLPLYLSYFAYSPQNLPTVEQIIKDTRQMSSTLQALRKAPVAEPYTGPALLAGEASGVFFHEIFGHRTEGLRMKSESDGQTFKNMVGQDVLPSTLQVFDDPTLQSYAGVDLNGYYKYDDEGVKAERVNVVVNGKLNEFLMTRTPIDNHPHSNGHARASDGFDPVSRQANLLVETKDFKTNEELRKMLLEEVKKQGKEYGYFFKEVTGGLTYAAKGSANSFNVTPLEVYRVYLDGRPDELVRGVDLIGTPLSMFANIVCAGGESQVFTGMCGAESGEVPVTAISPMILVSTVETQRKAKSQDILPILPRPERKY